MAVTSPNERRWAVGPYAVASRTPSHGPGGNRGPEPVARPAARRTAVRGTRPTGRSPRSMAAPWCPARPPGPIPGRDEQRVGRSRSHLQGQHPRLQTVRADADVDAPLGGRADDRQCPTVEGVTRCRRRSARSVLGLALHMPASTPGPGHLDGHRPVDSGDQPAVGVPQLDGDEGQVGVVGAQLGSGRPRPRASGSLAVAGWSGRSPPRPGRRRRRARPGRRWSPAPPASGAARPPARGPPRSRPAPARPRRRRRTPRR